jgi:hypothetical protein
VAEGLVDDKTQELLSALLAYPAVKPEWKAPSKTARTPGDLPVIPISFVKDDRVLKSV